MTQMNDLSNAEETAQHYISNQAALWETLRTLRQKLAFFFPRHYARSKDHKLT